MVKIAQLGSYDRNIGDNIALYNIREFLELNRPKTKEKIEWINLDISTFHDSKNSIEHSKNVFKDLQENHNIDMLIIGGGGLIENDEKYDSGWKLPFTEEVLKEIKVPIVVFASGINYFYNFPKLNDKAKKEVINLANKAALFSLRNDGSLEIFKSFCDSKAEELPDPGLVFNPEFIQNNKVKEIKDGCFQPAWNNSQIQKIGRRFNSDNIAKINRFCIENKLVNFCHTSKDFSFPWQNKKYVIPRHLFDIACKFHNVLKSIDLYNVHDFAVVMRGHGQLITIGINLPAIYLSTQPKLIEFSKKNNFLDYTVDIREQNWFDNLKSKTDLLKNNQDYLNNWYEIRNKNVLLYNKQMNDFCKKVWELL